MLSKSFFFLLFLFFSAVQIDAVTVSKSTSSLTNGDVEVILSFTVDDRNERATDVTFHDHLPVHVELKEGDLVGLIREEIRPTIPVFVRYVVTPVGLELGLKNRTIDVELPSATFSYKTGPKSERTQAKTNPAVASFPLSFPQGHQQYPELIAFVTIALPVISALFAVNSLVGKPMSKRALAAAAAQK
eukprot:CAMPEP_0201490188 /NCGR_PEP_ID=MMETSP0151_2-20130828/25414_1 /ASSEMBLY_ACC=CAM_ASM_000257 /TAXON_ID=200890 /ORGANISM="Paramoeba atlantica, Strain 621/1 / CCAP 1560/9" /LENGTH=187 /DNA_ID=CAMNT_0047876043 /DNA_START=80 /DNA_END=640 /DNA_ORIENTATION=-